MLYGKFILSYNTRYATKKNLYEVSVRTNTGKQTLASTSSRVWQTLPTELKNLKTTSLSEKIKQYLLLWQIGS